MITEKLAVAHRPTLVLVLVLATLVVIGPMLFLGIPASRDSIQHFHHAMTFYDSMSSGDVMPSWMADSNGGYGDVSVRFYPPGLSLILAFLRMTLGSWYWANVLGFGMLTLVGAFAAYLWGREFISPNYAMWAGVLFVVTPYHINELFQSALLAEYAAVSVLPLSFAFTERIIRGGGRKDIACLAAAYALLILFNLPMAVIGSYSLLLYVLLRLEWSKALVTISRLTLGVLGGLVCSAFYWITIITELSWLRPDTQNPFSADNFLFSSFRITEHGTDIWYGNLIELATLAMAIPGLVLLTGAYRRSEKRLLIGVGILFLVSVLMATPISAPLWNVLPQLKEVQLQWRWMAITSICVSLLVAASIPAWIDAVKGKARPLALLAIGAVLMSLAFTVSHPIREAHYFSKAEIDAISTRLHGFETVGQWYPRWVGKEILLMNSDVDANGREVSIQSWQPEHRRFEVEAGTANDARVRTLYYPLWQATVNGSIAQTRPDSDGAMLISIPNEKATVDLDFREPRKSKIAAIVSLVGWFLLLLVWFAFKAKGPGNPESPKAQLDPVNPL